MTRYITFSCPSCRRAAMLWPLTGPWAAFECQECGYRFVRDAPVADGAGGLVHRTRPYEEVVAELKAQPPEDNSYLFTRP